MKMNKTYDHRPNFDTDVQSFKNKQQFLVGISLYCYACCVVETPPLPPPRSYILSGPLLQTSERNHHCLLISFNDWTKLATCYNITVKYNSYSDSMLNVLRSVWYLKISMETGPIFFLKSFWHGCLWHGQLLQNSSLISAFQLSMHWRIVNLHIALSTNRV